MENENWPVEPEIKIEVVVISSLVIKENDDLKVVTDTLLPFVSYYSSYSKLLRSCIRFSIFKINVNENKKEKFNACDVN